METLPTKVDDLQLTATLPSEMVESQQSLIEWCEKKIAYLKVDSKELKESYLHAKKSKWKYKVLENHYRKSVKVIEFYDKMKTALMNGFYIVPNFPIQMFAIKTKKPIPSQEPSWSYWDNHEQKAQELPETVGEYQNPYPVAHKRKIFKNDREGVQDQYYAHHWDEFEFPLTMAKPAIMEATSRAIALKIFDQIGIMPATKKDDPVIIGQIFRRNGYNTKTISFMIAWHLNTNVL